MSILQIIKGSIGGNVHYWSHNGVYDLWRTIKPVRRKNSDYAHNVYMYGDLNALRVPKINILQWYRPYHMCILTGLGLNALVTLMVYLLFPKYIMPLSCNESIWSAESHYSACKLFCSLKTLVMYVCSPSLLPFYNRGY